MIQRESLQSLRRSPARTALTIVLAGALAALTVSHQFYVTALVSVFFAFALASVVILHLSVAPLSDAVPVLLLAAAFAAVDFVLLRYPMGVPLAPVLSLLGMASLIVLTARCIWTEGDARKPLLAVLVPAVLFVSSDWFAQSLLELTGRWHAKALDLYLLPFDASLGFQPSFVLGQWFARWQWFRILCLLFYVGLPLPLAAAYAGQLRRRSGIAWSAGIAFLITGPMGVVFYNIFPANGPHNMFGTHFPFEPMSAEAIHRLLLEPIVLPGYHNAIPSLHMGWVMLAWWYSRGLSLGTRIFAGMFVVFTVLSTMGTGEHWMVDLVVGFPFALLVSALADTRSRLLSRERLTPLFAGLGMTLGWFALLRYAPHIWWISPAIPWGASAATVVACSMLATRLLTAPSRSSIIGLGPSPTTKDQEPTAILS